MKEIKELLEGKLLEILENDQQTFNIKDIKEAAAVLRELREMERPEEDVAAGGVVQLG